MFMCTRCSTTCCHISDVRPVATNALEYGQCMELEYHHSYTMLTGTQLRNYIRIGPVLLFKIHISSCGVITTSLKTLLSLKVALLRFLQIRLADCPPYGIRSIQLMQQNKLAQILLCSPSVHEANHPTVPLLTDLSQNRLKTKGRGRCLLVPDTPTSQQPCLLCPKMALTLTH